MGMELVLGYIAEIGLGAVKDKITDSAMETTVRNRLTTYLGRQHKLNFNCTTEEEFDFEGLSAYICNDLIEDVKLRFLGNKGDRDNAHKTFEGHIIHKPCADD